MNGLTALALLLFAGPPQLHQTCVLGLRSGIARLAEQLLLRALREPAQVVRVEVQVAEVLQAATGADTRVQLRVPVGSPDGMAVAAQDPPVGAVGVLDAPRVEKRATFRLRTRRARDFFTVPARSAALARSLPEPVRR